MDALAIVAAIAALYALSSLRIIKQYERAVTFFLGRYWNTKGPGLVFLPSMIAHMHRVSLRIVALDIPPPTGGTPPAAPTGIIFNSSPDFRVGTNAAHFIFATEDGTSTAWASGTNAVLAADNSTASAIALLTKASRTASSR